MKKLAIVPSANFGCSDTDRVFGFLFLFYWGQHITLVRKGSAKEQLLRENAERFIGRNLNNPLVVYYEENEEKINVLGAMVEPNKADLNAFLRKNGLDVTPVADLPDEVILMITVIS